MSEKKQRVIEDMVNDDERGVFGHLIFEFRAGHITEDQFRGLIRKARESWEDAPRQKQLGTGSMRRDRAFRELGLNPNASQDQIRAAYRRLAILNHPDHGGDTKRMAAINTAYHTLTG